MEYACCIYKVIKLTPLLFNGANNVSTDFEQLRCSYLLHRKQRMSNVPKGHYSAPTVLYAFGVILCFLFSEITKL